MRAEADQPQSCPGPEPTTSGACILRTPVSLTGAMVSILRAYFGSSSRAALEKASFLWNEKPDETELYISDEFNWDLRQVGVRPALIVSLDDFVVGSGSDTIGRRGLSGHSAETGGFNISSRESGAFTIQCIAKQKLECWSLAWEVKVLIQSYAHEIGKSYRFGSISVAGIRKPTPLPEDNSYMISSVGIPFHIVNTFHVYKEALPATTFDLKVHES